MKPKVNRRTKIAKFRAKINKMDTKKVKKKKKKSMKYALYLSQPLSEVSPSALSVPACVSGVTGALPLLLAACIPSVNSKATRDTGVVGFSAMLTVTWIVGFATTGGKEVREV